MTKAPLKILVAEDDPLLATLLIRQLETKARVDHVTNPADAQAKLAESTRENHLYDLSIIDLNLDDSLDGLPLVEKSKKIGIYTVVLSSETSSQIIEQAYQAGCDDFFAKKNYLKNLSKIVAKIEQLGDGEFENFFEEKFQTRNSDLIETLTKLLKTDIAEKSLLINGETGVGKTHLARLFHEFNSPKGRFISINCAEVPENLVESELFGHSKGAFTGAEKDRKGKILSADGGTLFLDEIGNMPMPTQKKLLKALDEKQFYPIGSDTPVKSSFTLISATYENLETMVEKGTFREDLYYRIRGFRLRVPPLRERPEDIDFFLEQFLAKSERRFMLKPKAKEFLFKHKWPGNVRELKRTLEVLGLSPFGVIELKDVQEAVENKTENKPERPIQKDSLGKSSLKIETQVPNRASNPKAHSRSQSQSQSQAERTIDSKMLESLITDEQWRIIRNDGWRHLLRLLEEEATKKTLKDNNHVITRCAKDLKVSASAFYRMMSLVK